MHYKKILGRAIMFVLLFVSTNGKAMKVKKTALADVRFFVANSNSTFVYIPMNHVAFTKSNDMTHSVVKEALQEAHKRNIKLPVYTYAGIPKAHKALIKELFEDNLPQSTVYIHLNSWVPKKRD
jgi:hypothetical protein